MSVNKIQFALCLQQVLQLHTVLFIKKCEKDVLKDFCKLLQEPEFLEQV
jgi:hypothetical protein